MFQQIALIVTIVAGFAIGYVLPLFTEEEMKQGKKYFKALEIVLFLLILVFAVLLYEFLFIIAVILLLVGCPRRIAFVYIFLFCLTIYQPEAIIAALGFLYGLPAGTLYRIRKN